MLRSYTSGEVIWMSFSGCTSLPNCPLIPSSARAQLWRHLRAVDEVSHQNGVWALPAQEAHEHFLRDEVAQVKRHGGAGLLFQAPARGNALVGRFHDERDQGYAECASAARRCVTSRRANHRLRRRPSPKAPGHW